MLVWFSSRKIVNILLDIVTKIMQVIWTNEDQKTSYVFTIANAPVSWTSILQSTVALSTTKAEYMAITEAVKEAI